MSALRTLTEGQGAQILVSNTVIGEPYVAVQHHYGVSKADARSGMLKVVRRGSISPLNGQRVLTTIESQSGVGLTIGSLRMTFRRAGLLMLALDRQMSAVPTAQLIITTQPLRQRDRWDAPLGLLLTA